MVMLAESLPHVNDNIHNIHNDAKLLQELRCASKSVCEAVESSFIPVVVLDLQLAETGAMAEQIALFHERCEMATELRVEIDDCPAGVDPQAASASAARFLQAYVDYHVANQTRIGGGRFETLEICCRCCMQMCCMCMHYQMKMNPVLRQVAGILEPILVHSLERARIRCCTEVDDIGGLVTGLSEHLVRCPRLTCLEFSDLPVLNGGSAGLRTWLSPALGAKLRELRLPDMVHAGTLRMLNDITPNLQSLHIGVEFFNEREWVLDYTAYASSNGGGQPITVPGLTEVHLWPTGECRDNGLRWEALWFIQYLPSVRSLVVHAEEQNNNLTIVIDPSSENGDEAVITARDGMLTRIFNQLDQGFPEFCLRIEPGDEHRPYGPAEAISMLRMIPDDKLRLLHAIDADIHVCWDDIDIHNADYEEHLRGSLQGLSDWVNAARSFKPDLHVKLGLYQNAYRRTRPISTAKTNSICNAIAGVTAMVNPHTLTVSLPRQFPKFSTSLEPWVAEFKAAYITCCHAIAAAKIPALREVKLRPRLGKGQRGLLRKDDVVTALAGIGADLRIEVSVR